MESTANVSEMNFGKILRSLRLREKYSQEQIAEKLFITRPAYTYYETGRTVPDVEMIRKISIIYGIEPEELIGYSDDLQVKACEADSLGDPGELTEYEKKLIMLIRANRSEDESKDMLSAAIKIVLSKLGSHEKRMNKENAG